MIDWNEAFRRLEHGESYQKVANALGVAVGTLYRRHLGWLQGKVDVKARELGEVEKRIGTLTKQVEGLTEEYKKKKQEEEAKLQETHMKQEQGGKRRLERINAELIAKEKLMPECARRGLTLEQCLEAVKKIANLGGEISRREKILGEWNAAIFERQRRYDELDRQIKEKEGHLGSLIAKQRSTGQALQHSWAEFQQLQEKIFRQSGQVKELGEMKARLDAEVGERERRNKALELDRAPLEKGNAELKKANAEIKTMINEYVRKMLEVAVAERELDAEFERRRKEIDENIKKRVEEGRTIVEEEVRRIAGEGARRVPALRQRAEELRIRIMALSSQLAETAYELSEKEKRNRELDKGLGLGKRFMGDIKAGEIRKWAVPAEP